jgi:hypothetical protein
MTTAAQRATMMLGIGNDKPFIEFRFVECLCLRIVDPCFGLVAVRIGEGGARAQAVRQSCYKSE